MYTSNVTNSTYMLDTAPANFLHAEANCRLHGGHLTSYASAEEQRDVENYFVSTGLCPAHRPTERIPAALARGRALNAWTAERAWAMHCCNSVLPPQGQRVTVTVLSAAHTATGLCPSLCRLPAPSLPRQLLGRP
jgi:hypothetical protein